MENRQIKLAPKICYTAYKSRLSTTGKYYGQPEEKNVTPLDFEKKIQLIFENRTIKKTTLIS